MKKFISVLLLCFIVFSSVGVFAVENETRRELLKIVKERLEISDSYDDFNSSLNEGKEGTTYSFSWSNSETGESIDAAITSDGIITSYYNYVPEYSASKKLAFNDELRLKAAETAKAFIKKINPALSEKIVLNEKEDYDISPYNFSFDFYVTENGFKTDENNGYISLNSGAERVTGFYMNYFDGVDYKDPSGIITKEEAAKAYFEKLGLKLVYKMYRDEKTVNIYPAYIEKETDEKYIDAFSGEVIKPEKYNDVFPHGDNGALAATGNLKESVAEAAEDEAFSEAETEELKTVSGLMSKEEAEKIVRENKIIGLGQGLELTSAKLSKEYYDGGKYLYSLFFLNENDNIKEKELKSLRVVLNAKNGNITSFYKNFAKSTEKENISADKAKNIADSVLKELGGASAKDYNYEETQNSYFFTYVRHVNEIPFSADTANISVSPESGEVISWSINETNAKFPSLENVISEEEAANALFNAVSYEPVYVLSVNKDYTYRSNLVYAITDENSVTINAFNGRLVNYKNEEIENINTSPAFSDLEGHWAKEKIEKLAKYGIISLNDTEFKPDSEITQKELLAYTLAVFNGGGSISFKTNDEIKNLYQRAIRKGYITESEKNPDGYVTKLDAAKILVRAMGFGEIAEINGIFNAPFADAANDSGYLAVLFGMNVIQGSGNGLFHPNNNIKKAEFASMLYNYLAR